MDRNYSINIYSILHHNIQSTTYSITTDLPQIDAFKLSNICLLKCSSVSFEVVDVFPSKHLFIFFFFSSVHIKSFFFCRCPN